MAEAIEQKEEKTPSEPASKDVKIAEIWIKDGKVMLDACPEFYHNKLMAVGVLEYCKDIVKNTNYEEDKPKIQVASGVNCLRNFLNKKKK
jgi:hypothetical protein